MFLLGVPCSPRFGGGDYRWPLESEIEMRLWAEQVTMWDSFPPGQTFSLFISGSINNLIRLTDLQQTRAGSKSPQFKCCWWWWFSLASPWTVSLQVPLFMGFPRQESWSALTFHSSGDPLDPEMKSGSPTLQADHQWSHREAPSILGPLLKAAANTERLPGLGRCNTHKNWVSWPSQS